MTLTKDSVPSLWRLARVEYDHVRARPVLLYPEGAVFLNETGAEILRLVDGQRTVGEIASTLAQRYDGEGSDPAAILEDVTEYLSGLAARELIRDQ